MLPSASTSQSSAATLLSIGCLNSPMVTRGPASTRDKLSSLAGPRSHGGGRTYRPITNEIANSSANQRTAAAHARYAFHLLFMLLRHSESSLCENHCGQLHRRRLSPLTDLSVFSPSRGSEFSGKQNSTGRATPPSTLPASLAQACARHIAGSPTTFSHRAAPSSKSFSRCATNTYGAVESSSSSISIFEGPRHARCTSSTVSCSITEFQRGVRYSSQGSRRSLIGVTLRLRLRNEASLRRCGTGEADYRSRLVMHAPAQMPGHLFNWDVAQPVEHRAVNATVAGSSPAISAISKIQYTCREIAKSEHLFGTRDIALSATSLSICALSAGPSVASGRSSPRFISRSFATSAIAAPNSSWMASARCRRKCSTLSIVSRSAAEFLNRQNEAGYHAARSTRRGSAAHANNKHGSRFFSHRDDSRHVPQCIGSDAAGLAGAWLRPVLCEARSDGPVSAPSVARVSGRAHRRLDDRGRRRGEQNLVSAGLGWPADKPSTALGCPADQCLPLLTDLHTVGRAWADTADGHGDIRHRTKPARKAAASSSAETRKPREAFHAKAIAFAAVSVKPRWPVCGEENRSRIQAERAT